MLLLLLLLLFICHCASTITDEQQQNYTVTTRTAATKRSIYINCSIFCSNYSCCYCAIFLLLLFISSCESIITDETQQHETVTARTEQRNLHKLLKFQELISPIHIPMYDLPLQQLNMK